MIATLAAIEMVLDEMGHAVTLGAAAAAASRVIRSGDRAQASAAPMPSTTTAPAAISAGEET